MGHQRHGTVWRRGLLSAVLVAGGAAPVAAQGADTPGQAFREGQFGLGLRYRLETVDDDAFSAPGWASTLRTVLSFQTLPWHGFSAGVEVVNVADVGMGDLHDNLGYGHLGNGVRDRPVIADPALTEVNQATLGWGLGPLLQVRAGRREITLANQRFVGDVGWRQNHQSFDALTLEVPVGQPTGFTYAYVDKVHGVTGDSFDMASHLLELDVALWGKAGVVSVYGFLLDYREETDEPLSTATFGARLEHAPYLTDTVIGHVDLELAHQQDYAGNPEAVDAWYYRAGVGASAGGWSARLTWEVLEGAPGKGTFTTPLATLHRWNGWADQFAVTPPNGLEDGYLELAKDIGAARLQAVYHRFGAATGGADYGRELDFEARYVTPWEQTIALGGALYNAEEFSRDVRKVWLWTSWNL